MDVQMLWLAGIGGALIGLVLGAVWGRSRSSGDANRVLEVEEQLRIAESDHAQYRAQVSGHFVETSRRLNDLTLQYKSVYEHLADGARALCPEGAVAIAPNFAEAALPETVSPPAPERDESQLDLELDAPGRWSADPGADDELGPLLDEEAPPPPTAQRL